MTYQAVFFDAGDTLLSAHPSFHELFGVVLAERGHRISLERIEQAFEEIAPTFTEVLDRLGTDGWSTSPQVSRAFWGTVYGAAFEQLQLEDSEGMLADALYERFTRFESYRLFPDTIPVLTALREAGLIVGLISNFEEWLEGMLIEMEVAHLFDIMVISGKVGVEKPDPRIFRMAIERSQIGPADAMYVGDHPRLDVEGSIAIGMTGVLIDRKDRHRGFEGLRVTSLEGILPMVGLG